MLEFPAIIEGLSISSLVTFYFKYFESPISRYYIFLIKSPVIFISYTYVRFYFFSGYYWSYLDFKCFSIFLPTAFLYLHI